jgi:hypothetical protein
MHGSLILILKILTLNKVKPSEDFASLINFNRKISYRKMKIEAKDRITSRKMYPVIFCNRLTTK